MEVRMNAIFKTVAQREAVRRTDTALCALSLYLDNEADRARALLALCGDRSAAATLDSLQLLHIEADATEGDLERLVAGALASLEFVLERVGDLPSDSELHGAPPADFDAWLRWSGARLEDVVASLRRCLLN